MPAKPTLYDTADHFQREADRTRNPERKAYYQRCAELYLAEAKKAEPDQHVTRSEEADSLKS